MLTRIVFTLIVALLASSSFAAEIKGAKNQAKGLKPENRQPKPVVAPASPEAANNLKRIKVPDGLQLYLWAAEPMLANPVAFCIDEKGRVFVSETYRYRTSALDIRHYMFMLEDDLALRTVEERVAMSRKHFGKQFDDLKIETEVVRLLEDRTGSGVADFSSIYADKFNSPLDGIASGVLARQDKVWFTNIPELWQLSGTDAQGRAKSRKSLSHGYGVRFSFTGHDMHGLVFGPDGKLYFTMGDRGATVKTKEGKTLSYPDEGAVFRCNPDGTEMEVIYRGLRNPQELAFDDYGNLFTGDNDFDHGDEERLVYIVEGGDSGWRVGYQHSLIGFDYVPWKSEEIWMSHASRQADYNGKPLEASKRVADTGRRPAAYLPPE
jgi:quinoprotein glucose dehydrogenase